ncbi:hypothetical protein ABH920_001459 [Catenulispora sp. EB89]|uniref:hypothetical protein n=1 Tax=Catenulispora sp. EB89 TaxID=3156257 RepID=UPI0035123B0B
MSEPAWYERTAEAVNGNRIEREILLDLVERCAKAAAEPDPALDRLVEDLARLSDHPEPGSLDLERRLDSVSQQLRRALLARAHSSIDPYFRSPTHERPTVLPSGRTMKYSYERSADPAWLEERLGRSAPDAPNATGTANATDGWHSEHVVFGSGTAAISAVLNCYLRMVPADVGHPVRAGVWASYFETDMVFEFRSSPLFGWERLTDLGKAVSQGAYDLLFVEPVRYNWDLDAVDLRDVLSRWRARGAGRPRCVVFDTTLSSFTWPSRKVLEALRDGDPLLVVELRSGLKLDQQGLELGNLGLVTVHSVDEDAGTPSAEQFAGHLRMSRAVTGTSVPVDAAAALDVPIVLDPALTARHAGQVFLANQCLAAELESEAGLFSAVGHPSLPDVPAGTPKHAPFVVCRLAEDEIAHHGLLLAVVRHEALRRGLLLDWGSSFGFRGHRCETILPRLKDRKGLFKIAMGARSGPSLAGTVELLREMARFPDFRSLRAAYPDVPQIDLAKYADPADAVEEGGDQLAEKVRA